METSKQHELDKVGIGAAWIAALGWASTGIFVRHFSTWPPLSIVAGRFIVAFAAICLVLMIINRRVKFVASIRSPLTWGLAVLMVVYYLCATIAFQLAPVGEVALGISLSPVFVLIFHLLSGRKTPRMEKIGSAISLFGVVVVFAPNLASQSSFEHHVTGCLLAIAGALIMAIYSLAYQYRSPKREAPSPLVVAWLTFTLGLFFLITYLSNSPNIRVFIQLQQNTPMMLMLGLGIVATILPTLSYSIASHRLSSMMTTSIRLATPIIAALLAIVFLHEMPSHWFWLGGSLVVSGLLLMTWKKKSVN
jgi:drug/metabolite transporter, DME family